MKCVDWNPANLVYGLLLKRTLGHFSKLFVLNNTSVAFMGSVYSLLALQNQCFSDFSWPNVIFIFHLKRRQFKGLCCPKEFLEEECITGIHLLPKFFLRFIIHQCPKLLLVMRFHDRYVSPPLAYASNNFPILIQSIDRRSDLRVYVETLLMLTKSNSQICFTKHLFVVALMNESVMTK